MEVSVIPITVDALGTIPKNLEKGMSTEIGKNT